MSTDYVLDKKIPLEQLFDGRLEKYGVMEQKSDSREPNKYGVLTDGFNRISVFGNGNVKCIKRSGRNNAAAVLAAICEAFDTRAYSEYDPQFWGYETEEEWMAQEYIDKYADEIYCAQLLDILKQGKIPDDSNDRILEDIELIKSILCEFPKLGSKGHLIELATRLRQRRSE